MFRPKIIDNFLFVLEFLFSRNWAVTGYFFLCFILRRTCVSGSSKDGNSISRTITEIKHLELKQSLDG